MIEDYFVSPMADLSYDPYTTPIGIPPSGVESNLINPESQSWVGRLVIYLTLPPMVLFVALRFYARLVVVIASVWSRRLYALKLSTPLPTKLVGSKGYDLIWINR